MTARTVLVVDDDADIRALVELALEIGAGWRVVGEAEGERAVARALEVAPDAVLLDVNLGAVSGEHVLDMLRRHERTAHVPVIFLTANVRAADVERLRAMGAGVLSKPFDPMTLAAQIASELGWSA